MMTTSRKPLKLVLGTLVLVLATGTAWAQSTTPVDPSQDTGMGTMQTGRGDMSGMRGMHRNAMGMHTMPATVTAVDKQTGLVQADAAGMALKLHFPPAAIANLKTGDKITLHMGYSKP